MPLARSSASTKASSSAAFAIGLPRTSPKARSAPSASTSPARNSRGARKSRSTSHAPSLNSPLKSGCGVGDALPPAFRVVGLHANQDAALVGHLAEAGAEWPDQRQLDEEQFDRANAAHGDAPGTRT